MPTYGSLGSGFNVEDLVGLEMEDFAVDREFVMIDFIRDTALVELHPNATGVERVDRFGLVCIALYAVKL
jgi:hypothetical protein